MAEIIIQNNMTDYQLIREGGGNGYYAIILNYFCPNPSLYQHHYHRKDRNNLDKSAEGLFGE